MAKNDLIERLRSDPRYTTAVEQARTPVERQAIVDLVEGLVGAVGDLLAPVIAQAQSDSAFAHRLVVALNAGSDLINSDPTVSGSVVAS